MIRVVMCFAAMFVSGSYRQRKVCKAFFYEPILLLLIETQSYLHLNTNEGSFWSPLRCMFPVEPFQHELYMQNDRAGYNV